MGDAGAVKMGKLELKTSAERRALEGARITGKSGSHLLR